MPHRKTDLEIETELHTASHDALQALVAVLWRGHFSLLLGAQEAMSNAYLAAQLSQQSELANRHFLAKQALIGAIDHQRTLAIETES